MYCLLSHFSDWENCDIYTYISESVDRLDRGICLTDAAEANMYST